MLITLVATLGFAVLYAGIISAILAPHTTSASFVARLTDHLLSPLFLVPVVGFFFSLSVLVLIANRAGWWAYVLGGFIVGAAVYSTAIAGLLLAEPLTGMNFEESVNRILEFLVSPFTLLAGIAARETTVWFGAWIAARGKKVKLANAAELAEHEQRVAASTGAALNGQPFTQA